MRFTKVSIFVAFWIFLLYLAGCSTTNHAPTATEVYHDITGHYNAYFNANEKMKSVYVAMDKAHKDNYKDVLSLYTYSNPKEATAVTSDLEDIEKRLTRSAQIHKVSNWVDDDFVMMGKTNYIKGNYDKALAFFKYTTTEYKNGVDYVKEMKKMGKVAKPTLKKKPAKKPKFEQVLDEKGNLMLKKLDERPSYTWLIHEPARAEALIWVARTYIAQAKYAEASAVIQYMRSDDKFYRNLDKYVELTEAENLMKQKNYKDAIQPLEKFLTMTKSKRERVRPIFILAQIYEKEGNFGKASEYYKAVLDNKPTYEMEFYAKIKRAKLGQKGGSSDEIKKLLVQMSHDGKYRDYLDQIYYELGEIVLGENNRAEARKDFHHSVATSTKNPDQKALSYLALAQMDYSEEFYVSAKFFYDSTLKSMAKTDSAYESVDQRDKTLDKLVTQINIITAEDSLERIAAMSAADRSRFLKKLIADKQKELDARVLEKFKGPSPDFMKGPGGGPAVSAATPGGAASEEASDFYFYNTGSRANGYNEFLKRWGNRKLEENWRRKDKNVAMTDNTSESDSVKSDKDSTNIVPGSEEDKLMAGLPMTPEKLEKSQAKLIDAYYALGTIYKDDLQSYRKSITAYEELNRRFPKNKLELESFYQLYLLHERLKNTAKADYYKEQILANYPNTPIGMYLKDPNYLVEMQKKDNALANYYQSTYNDYTSELYASAEKKVREVDVQFKENKMRAKFDLLNAMILSKENRLADYVEALNKIITKYPSSPEKDQAQAMLTKLNHSKLAQIDISKLAKDSLGNPIGAPTAPVFNTNILSDTSGSAAFLNKMQHNKPASKAAASGDTSKVIASANIPAADKEAPAAKTYKPLTKTQRLDSIMNAAKAPKSNPTTASVTPPAGSPAATTTPASGSSTASSATPGSPGASAPDDTKAIKDTASKPYKPLSKSERLDSIMKAAKNPKNNTSTVISSKPVPKDTAAKVYKPLTKAERLDSIMKADKAAQKSGTVISTKPAVKDTSAKTGKPLSKSERLDSIMKADKAQKSGTVISTKPAAKDTSAKATKPLTKSERLDSMMKADKAQKSGTVISSKPAAKDTTVKKVTTTPKAPTKAAIDSAAKKTTGAKPIAKTAAKDSVAKKSAAKPAAKDTVPAKPPVAAAPRPAFDTDTLTDVYGKSDGAPHYVVIYFLDPSAYNNGIEKKIDAFNAASYSANNLSDRAVVINKDNILINIKSFKDKDVAMAYVAALRGSDVLSTLKADQYFLGAVSSLNYSTLLSTKKINNYARFYRTNYK